MPVRAPLPRDPTELPAITAEFREVVDQALVRLGLELTPGMREAIDAQARLLVAWGPIVNLSAIRDPEAIALEHVADSLAAVPPLLDHLAGRRTRRRAIGLLDLGSGAGYPGLPVAVAVPVATAALVESVSRKAAFLDVAALAAERALAAHGEEPVRVRVVTARAEELARRPDHRGRWDVVTARAVAPLPALLELALPLVRVGGLFVAWKRDAGDGAFDAELAAALPLLAELGADSRPEVRPVTLEGLRDHVLVFIIQRRAAPQRRRRRVGRPPRLLP
ncbi:MAG TPA: RsmG family class I SAM-dependent methyltransferase [Candidatus Acidoferrales bacterium]|nr:RsmG family class I SAM-dependent methyltransferase [Candidatus Acidoferrales bacterium]